MSTPQQPYQPQPGQPPHYQPMPPQRSVAGTTMKVLLTIGAVVVGIAVLLVVGIIVIMQIT